MRNLVISFGCIIALSAVLVSADNLKSEYRPPPRPGPAPKPEDYPPPPPVPSTAASLGIRITNNKIKVEFPLNSISHFLMTFLSVLDEI